MRGVEVIREVLRSIPNTPGVYKMLSASSEVLYIGKAKDLSKRLPFYANETKLSVRLRKMVESVRFVEYIVTASEADAFLLEASLIKSTKPLYNINLKDDKSFPYILFDDRSAYPKVGKYRGRVVDKNFSYFGPFASAGQVKLAISEIQKLFGIRSCTDSYMNNRKRPCIQYQIKRCTGPCVGKISEAEYGNNVRMAKDFLRGKNSLIQKQLLDMMQKASEATDYEKAAEIRDKIRVLTSIQSRNVFNNIQLSECDIIGVHKFQNAACIKVYFIRGGSSYGDKSYYQFDVEEISESQLLEDFIGQFYQVHTVCDRIVLSHKLVKQEVVEEGLKKLSGREVKILTVSNKTKDLINFAVVNATESLEVMMRKQIETSNTLDRIGELFDIKGRINRIEVYDNSHTFGSHPIGYMVVCGRNGFQRSEYRQFNIKEVSDGDDYHMLREVLSRRIRRMDPSNKPDMMLIDGGKGHLSVVLGLFDILKVDGIKVVCISKGVDRNAGREFFHTKDKEAFQLPCNDEALKFMQILRDEVHNYAIKSHRRKRGKDIKKSGIDNIPGIGVIKKRALLAHFGSVEGIASASYDDLMLVDGINKGLAAEILKFFNS